MSSCFEYDEDKGNLRRLGTRYAGRDNEASKSDSESIVGGM